MKRLEVSEDFLNGGFKMFANPVRQSWRIIPDLDRRLGTS